MTKRKTKYQSIPNMAQTNNRTAQHLMSFGATGELAKYCPAATITRINNNIIVDRDFPLMGVDYWQDGLTTPCTNRSFKFYSINWWGNTGNPNSSLWATYEPASTDVVLVNAYLGHTTVVKLYCTTDADAPSITYIQTNIALASIPQCSFYIAGDTASKAGYIYIYEGVGTERIGLYYAVGELVKYKDTDGVFKTTGYTALTGWHFIRLKHSSTTQFMLYIDETLIGTFNTYTTFVALWSHVKFTTGMDLTPFNIYFDAHSWTTDETTATRCYTAPRYPPSGWFETTYPGAPVQVEASHDGHQYPLHICQTCYGLARGRERYFNISYKLPILSFWAKIQYAALVYVNTAIFYTWAVGSIFSSVAFKPAGVIETNGVNCGTTYADNVWTHYCYEYINTTDIKFYINGKYINTSTCAQAIGANLPGAITFYTVYDLSTAHHSYWDAVYWGDNFQKAMESYYRHGPDFKSSQRIKITFYYSWRVAPGSDATFTGFYVTRYRPGVASVNIVNNLTLVFTQSNAGILNNVSYEIPQNQLVAGDQLSMVINSPVTLPQDMDIWSIVWEMI